MPGAPADRGGPVVGDVDDVPGVRRDGDRTVPGDAAVLAPREDAGRGQQREQLPQRRGRRRAGMHRQLRRDVAFPRIRCEALLVQRTPACVELGMAGGETQLAEQVRPEQRVEAQIVGQLVGRDAVGARSVDRREETADLRPQQIEIIPAGARGGHHRPAAGNP
jgi:hypothetical protein